MKELSKLLNNEMDETTHVIYLNVDSFNMLQCCQSPDAKLIFWSKDPKNFVSLYFSHLIAYFILLQNVEEEEFAETKQELNLINVINYYLAKDNNNVKVTEALYKIKYLYDHYNNKDIDYITFLDITRHLEFYLRRLGVYFNVNSYYSPLECRHDEGLKNKYFNFNDLQSNFMNYKDFSYLYDL